MPVYVLRSILNDLIARTKLSGVLIISSMFSRHFDPSLPLFCANKSFLSNLGRSLSFELDGLGVDVLTFEPGFMADTHPRPRTWLERSLTEEEAVIAKVGLAEMEMHPSGATCGTKIRHELSDLAALRLTCKFSN